MNKVIAITVFIITAWQGSVFAQFGSPARFDSVFTEYFRRNGNGWTAGDATISVPLSDHRVIWLFGDSYIVPVDTNNNTLPCLFQVRNCMMVQDSVDRSHFLTHIDSNATGINRTTFKLSESTVFQLLWPDHGFEYMDTVYIFLAHLDNSTWDLIDIYVAKLQMPGLEITGMVLLPDKAGYTFGRCVLTDTSAGYRYIYGNKVNWIVWEPFVARCPLDGLFGEWEYWTASGWSSNINALWKISEMPVSPSYSVVMIDGRYYLITQENGYLTCGLGREIYSYESDYPTGPFTNKRLLYTEESMFNERYLLTYNAFSHPYFTEDNELLISYNVNDRVDTLEPYVCPSQCVNIWTDRMDADTYRPKFVRVPLGLITGAGDKKIGHLSGILTPNPARPGQAVSWQETAHVVAPAEIAISDITGKTVIRYAGLSSRSFSAPFLPGLYFVRITKHGHPDFNGKLVVSTER